MLVTLFGIVTLVNWFCLNALSCMLVTLFGIVTLVKFLEINAAVLMLVTGFPSIVAGISTSLFVPVYPVMVTSKLLVKYRKSPAAFAS
ncbi:hypothetical protein GCM10020370_32680 [Paenibacillus hodogayensis]